MRRSLRDSLMILACAVLLVLPEPAGAQWLLPETDLGLSGAEVRAVALGSDGALWLGVRDRGLAWVEDGHIAWAGQEVPLPQGIASIQEDRAGRLWVAGLGGISVLRDGDWARQQTLAGVTPRVVFEVHDAWTGEIWAATSAGAARLTSSGWRILDRDEGLPHDVVHAVVVDRDGAAWLAGRNGLARVQDDEVSVFYVGLNFRSAAVGGDGTLWFGTHEGVFTWDGRSWARHREGRPTYPVTVDGAGVVWAAALGGGLLRFDGSAWDEIALPSELHGAEVYDLAVTPGGSIWVATALGLARYDP